MQFEVLPVTRYAQNCSIVWCEATSRAAVIDPGGDLPDILHYLELLELTAEVALVTHAHFDHCGAAARFAELTGARIEGPHRADQTLVESLPEQPLIYAELAGAMGSADSSRRDRSQAMPPPSQTPRRYTPSRWLDHGDVVRFGKIELEVLHCPGHTPGHVAYFDRSARQAFVGDILFRGSIGAWEHPGGSLPQLIHSIRDGLFPLGDDVAFVPGHGPTSTFGRERQDNPFVGDAAYTRWCERFPFPSAAD